MTTAKKVHPRISLVTVVLNAAEDFRRTRLSVEGQKRDWLEWVVVDGGSTDGTLAEIEEASPLIDVLVVEKDDGIYDAMNKGCRAAHGDFLWYMNAGDEVYPGALGHLDDVVSSWSADQIYCAQWIRRFPDGSEDLNHPEPGDLLFRMSVSHQATIHSKSALERLYLYDQRFRLAADFNFFLQARLQGVKFRGLAFPLALYHKGGRTDQAPIESKLETIKVLWWSDSPRKWRGIRKYIKEIRQILRKRIVSRVPERIRRILRPVIHG